MLLPLAFVLAIGAPPGLGGPAATPVDFPLNGGPATGFAGGATVRIVTDLPLSPEAQAHKANPAVWGDPTVLDLGKLTVRQRQAFTTGAGPDLLRHAAPTVPEPHASWVPLLEAHWLKRYGA